MTDPATLRRLAEAATPGPWSTLRQGNTYWAVIIRDDTPLLNNANECDAAYIAAANPKAVLALLDRLDCQSALCAAMAKWLANQQHWTDLPDDHVVLESRGTEGEFRITAGMIREANR